MVFFPKESKNQANYLFTNASFAYDIEFFASGYLFKFEFFASVIFYVLSLFRQIVILTSK